MMTGTLFRLALLSDINEGFPRRVNIVSSQLFHYQSTSIESFINNCYNLCRQSSVPGNLDDCESHDSPE